MSTVQPKEDPLQTIDNLHVIVYVIITNFLNVFGVVTINFGEFNKY